MKNFRKKTVPRALCALFCALLAVLPLASCGKSRTEGDKDFSLSTLRVVDPNSVPESSRDFSAVKSGTYTVLCQNPSNGLLGTSGESGDILDREIYLRNAKLKEEYSIELKEMTVAGDTAGFIQTSTKAGLISYDIASVTYSDAALLAMSGSLCALSDLGGYSQSQAMFARSLSSGGKQYIEDFSLFSSRGESTYAMALNRDRSPWSIGKTPAEKAVDGSLTYEYFDRLESEARIYMEHNGLAAFWSGGGTRFYLKGSGSDMPVYKRIGDDAKNIYSSIKALADAGIINDKNQYENGDTQVTEDKALADFIAGAAENYISVGTVSQIRSAIESGLKLELLPIPKQSAKSAYFSFVSPDALCTVLPAGDTNKNSVAFALTSILFDYDLDSALKSHLTELVPSKDAHTAEIVDIILSSRIFDLPSLYGIGGMYDFLGKCLKTNVSPDAFIEGINTRTQTAVVAIEIIRENSENSAK